MLLQRQAMKTQLHQKLIQPLAKVIQPLKVLLALLGVTLIRLLMIPVQPRLPTVLQIV